MEPPEDGLEGIDRLEVVLAHVSGDAEPELSLVFPWAMVASAGSGMIAVAMVAQGALYGALGLGLVALAADAERLYEALLMRVGVVAQAETRDEARAALGRIQRSTD